MNGSRTIMDHPELVRATCTHLGPAALAALAQTSSAVGAIAAAALYRHLAVAASASDPVQQWAVAGDGLRDYTVVVSPRRVALLLRTLSENPRLAALITAFALGPCSDAPAASRRVARAFVRVLEAHASCLAVFSCADPLVVPPGCRWPLARAQIGDLALDRTPGPLAQDVGVSFGGPSVPRSAVAPLCAARSAAHLSFLAAATAALFCTPDPPLPDTLAPQRLSLVFRHAAGGPVLNFARVARSVHLPSVRHLDLDLLCASAAAHADQQRPCACVRRVLASVALGARDRHQFRALAHLRLLFQPSDDWLSPSELLDQVLTPAAEAVGACRALRTLEMDFNTPLYKIYADSGMSSLHFNLNMNEKLMQAFFLPMTAARLESLVLPDFFMGFIFYKNFHESLLHTCRCAGCGALLRHIARLFTPLPEDELRDDHSASLYVLIGIVLDKLRTERRPVPAPVVGPPSDAAVLFRGEPNSLHRHLHTSECTCELDASHPMNVDTLVTTYIAHQGRPLVEYMALIFPALRAVDLHGLRFRGRAAGLACVSDASEYPAELFEVDVAPLEVPLEPFGRLSLL